MQTKLSSGSNQDTHEGITLLQTKCLLDSQTVSENSPNTFLTLELMGLHLTILSFWIWQSNNQPTSAVTGRVCRGEKVSRTFYSLYTTICVTFHVYTPRMSSSRDCLKMCGIIPIFKQYRASPLSMMAGISLPVPVWPFSTTINTCLPTWLESYALFHFKHTPAFITSADSTVNVRFCSYRCGRKALPLSQTC